VPQPKIDATYYKLLKEAKHLGFHRHVELSFETTILRTEGNG